MPELENGYTRIANELLEAIIQHGFNKRELTIMLAIIRKTYGYHKKTDDIATSQLSNATGITPNHVRETLKLLHATNVIVKKDGLYGAEIGLNKSYQEWGKRPKQVQKTPKTGAPKTGSFPPKTGGSDTQNGCPKRPKQVATKENSTKENSTKENNPLNPPQGELVNLGFTEQAKVILEHWQKVMNHPRAIFDDKRKNLIIKHLKSGYESHRLMDAVTGCSLSPYHMGKNESGTVYDGLDLILRDSSKIEKFEAFVLSPPRTQNKQDVLQQSNSVAVDEWLREEGVLK